MYKYINTNKNHKIIINNKLDNTENELIKNLESLNLKDNKIKENIINKENLLNNEKLTSNLNTDNNINSNINIKNNNNNIIHQLDIQYKYKDLLYIWKKIPFKNEVIPICENIHLITNHGGINICQRNLHNSEFYWHGYSNSMINVIKNCSLCTSINHNIAKKPKMKHIIPEGPHFRYQAGLWEFDESIKNKFHYNYLLEIKDCFSKWMWCYPLENKTGYLVLRKIKEYFISFGIPKIIQTDNGLEFCNIVSELYYENLGVHHVRISPRYPESNGQIEAQHKTLQKGIILAFKKNENIDLFDCIYDCLYNYNYNIEHTSTGYKPITLKDTEDLILINEVVHKINKTYEKFHINDSNLYAKDSKFLLIDNGIVNKKSKIIYKPKKKKLLIQYLLLLYL